MYSMYYVLSDLDFVLTFTLVVGSGSLGVFSQFLCTSVCSALTTALVGVAKAFLQTTVGFFVFGGVPFNIINVAGEVFRRLLPRKLL